MSVLQERSVCHVDWGSWDAGTLRYFTYLATRHDIDPYDLLSAFLEAERKGTAVCGPLMIRLRTIARDYAVFLLTRESEIVGQIRMSGAWKSSKGTRSLWRRIDGVRVFGRSRRQPSSIAQLREGMRNVNLKGRVTGKSRVLRSYSQDAANHVRGCIVIVGDPFGSVRLPLWNNQVDAVSVGDEIEIKNAGVVAFRGLLHIVPAGEMSELNIVRLSRPMDAKQPIQTLTENVRQTIACFNENGSQWTTVGEVDECLICTKHGRIVLGGRSSFPMESRETS